MMMLLFTLGLCHRACWENCDKVPFCSPFFSSPQLLAPEWPCLDQDFGCSWGQSIIPSGRLDSGQQGWASSSFTSNFQRT